MLKLGWVGFHEEGLPALEAVLARGAPVRGVITLTREAAARRSAAADYTSVSRRFGVPLFEVDDINGSRGLDVLHHLDLDLAFVIGWTQLVRPAARRLVRRGLIGAHASLLPHHPGRAPINWSLIRGETCTGDTLLWLDDSVDGGDVIDQARIPITPYDTCATLYAKVAESNRDMILRALPRLLAGERVGRRQAPSAEPLLPKRRPEHGLVDWTCTHTEVYDFVRALTRPYPGAFTWLEGRRWTIWHCAALAPGARLAEPGTVIGPVVSPVTAACGQLVQCGSGLVALLEMESDDGLFMQGTALSEQVWTGRRLSDG